MPYRNLKEQGWKPVSDLPCADELNLTLERDPNLDRQRLIGIAIKAKQGYRHPSLMPKTRRDILLRHGLTFAKPRGKVLLLLPCSYGAKKYPLEVFTLGNTTLAEVSEVVKAFNETIENEVYPPASLKW